MITPIADIQGTGGTSPLDGQTVTTSGVVTAAYGTGAGTFNGMYIQTGGTGGDTDATPGASDAVFVFGDNSQPAGVEIGDSVEVTGVVSEFQGTTEITPAAGGVVEIAEALEPVTALETTWFATDAEREAHEGELIAPQGAFTVSNVYNVTGGGNAFAEIGLAAGDEPLQQPTDVVDAQTGDVAGVVADNAARAVALDDGASANFMNAANTDRPLPWITGAANPPRVGAAVTFTGDVIMEFRNNAWKFQPTAPITDDGAGTATFGEDRAANAAPAEVGGDLTLATFNVLNYFTTTGADHVAAGGTCTYYNDRAGEPVAVNTCSGDGPRGAANDANLARQQAKIVSAINTMDADIVSLEEIENSVKMLGAPNRDTALSDLVAALNADAGTSRWAFAPSPGAGKLPALAEQDVIRTAFIYNPATVSLVGPSRVLVGSTPFNSAREPLAQAFKPIGASSADAFAVIVNHFKSKSSGDDDGTGQGLANPDRIAQAQALLTFAEQFRKDRGLDAVFLTGDFNSYSFEDPIQVLEDGGFELIESDDPSDASYSFSGLVGSIDHVLGNAAAIDMKTGADIWEINANESLAYQYSRYNYHGEIYTDDSPWSASDHNPEVIGLTADAEPSDDVDIQILATNDFHGRIQNDSQSAAAGAAVLSGAVKQLRGENPNTVFAAAGDLIGASTFESFIAEDKPTIDALNEAGLEVSAVGNHEFDQGYDDLVNRVMAAYDATDNPYGGAEWEYLGANVRFKDSQDPALKGTWIKEMDGVQVGFVGAVTEHLDELVSPAGIEDIEVTDVVEATNAAADDLTAEGADIVILLVHEGAPSTDCATMDDDPTSDFGSIVTGVNDNVDAIVSGHTHLAYNCAFPVAGWADRPVTERPVVSAGQYGYNLNKLVFTVDPTTGDVQAKAQEILPLKAANAGPANYPSDPVVEEIVADAVAEAEVLGAEPLGEIEGAFYRAKIADGATENRGGESTLGNLVAEIQRWATEAPEFGGAQIAFMNPGGLRADLTGTGDTFPKTVTYKQAATVQPFANTLVNMDLTGEQIETVLEQQWQPAGASRPFLKLGISEGFTYTYTPPAADAPAGSRGEVTGMWLDGVPIDPTATYSVTVNSFLASGGDNFGELAQGAGKQDTGRTDLQAQVDYFAEFAADQPLAVDYAQRAVGVTFPANAPAAYNAGAKVAFALSSLMMTGPGDLTDSQVAVSLDGDTLGSFPVTNTAPASVGNDEHGTAVVVVTLPRKLAAGKHELVVSGATTGTETKIPFTSVRGSKQKPSMTLAAPDRVAKGAKPTVRIALKAPGQRVTGRVKIVVGNRTVTKKLVDGRASVKLRPVRAATRVTVTYLGNDEFERVTRRTTIRLRK